MQKTGTAGILKALGTLLFVASAIIYTLSFKNDTGVTVYTAGDEVTGKNDDRADGRSSGTDGNADGENTSGQDPGVSAGKSQSGQELVNINLAGPDVLMTLPGIGAAKAAAIVSYREDNGSFLRIEDIMLVPGIKEGVFGKIKDHIFLGDEKTGTER